MSRKAFLLMIALILILSLSTIHASEVNLTDSSAENSGNETIILTEDNSLLYNVTSDNLSDCQSDISLNKTVKNHTEFTSPSASIYYKGFFKVTLRDSNSTLANKSVVFNINSINYTSVTDSNGVASLKLNLTPNKYVMTMFFDGDDEYESSNLTADFKVLSTIKASNISKYYKGSKKYTAVFYTSQGTALSSKNVKIKINGKSYTKKTDSRGSVSIAVNLKPGTYKIVAYDPVTGYALTTTFKILSTISSANINIVAGENKKFTAKFFKSNGKALAKKYIKIKLNGKKYKVKTNSNGKAGLSLKNLKKGTYKVVCYNKDALSKTYTIKVFKRKASTKLTAYEYVFLANDAKKIKIKFSTALNDNSKSGKTIKIKLNGKTYSKKTDSNGVIDFKLPSLSKGVYKVEYKYEGSKFFKKSASSKYITLLNDTSSTKLTVKSTTSFGYGAGTLFKVRYTADAVPLAKKTVTFNINGKKYTDTTDYKGIASIAININIGNYTIDYKTDNDSIVNGTSGSCDIDVFQRSPSKVTWKSGTSFKDSGQTFKVFVGDSDGNSVSDGVVELTIDGKSYKASVASNGYAKIKTNAPIGKYKVSVKFLGNNELLVSSASKSINVKLSKFGNGLNQKNTISYLKAYLKSSSHCKVGNAKIKALIKSLTSGLKDNVDKAKAIFNYVRDTLDYSLYYNTLYGAVGTLKVKKGNCVDHSHLLVSMFRTAGFKARYVHGVCHFNSGHTYGHVWTQVLIGKNWVCADATSYGNDLGRITNWNTNKYSVYAKYRSLPF